MISPFTSHPATAGTHLPVSVYPNLKTALAAVARQIADLIRTKAAAGQSCVLGLATGSSPTRVYEDLVRLHREDGLSFQSVVSFNLDEYFPMVPDSLQSCARFMREYLFDHVDIRPANMHIPDGTVAPAEVATYCQHYEAAIVAAAGGIDLQLPGIGRTRRIGFNEPGSGPTSRTRLIILDHVTCTDAASDFYGEENVPRRSSRASATPSSSTRAKRPAPVSWRRPARVLATQRGAQPHHRETLRRIGPAGTRRH